MKKKRSYKGARLGQHFLTGTWAAKKLAACVAVRDGETILEVGPGKGALTRELLATGAHVVAVEKDENLAAELHETFAKEIQAGKLKIIAEDIRSFDGERSNLGVYVVAANIPYYITGEIIRKFLTAARQPRAMALLVQKEVAERILARDGKESILSLSVKAYGTPSIVAKVSKGNFNPPPSVDSAILLIENISHTRISEEKSFFDVVHAGFASKRKQLFGNLKKKFGSRVEHTLKKLGIEKNVRAEDLPFSKWIQLAESIGSTPSS